MTSKNPTGVFYGIGVGPGDPELLTRKAARLLSEVDCVFLPAGASGEAGFAAQIIESLNLDQARLRPISLRMSRARATDVQAYARAAEDILVELRRGQSVAWLTEGDPLFYSTFVHVWTALRALAPDLTVEIVPGITSVQAAAACARVPIATLEERVAVIPAAYGLDRLAELLEQFGTVFLLKVHGVLEQLLDRLESLPGPVEAVYVEKVGTPEERVVRVLPTLRGRQVPYFSLVILRKL